MVFDFPGTVDGSEIRANAPVEEKVIQIPLFTRFSIQRPGGFG